jgi:hypothetical protein
MRDKLDIKIQKIERELFHRKLKPAKVKALDCIEHIQSSPGKTNILETEIQQLFWLKYLKYFSLYYKFNHRKADS